MPNFRKLYTKSTESLDINDMPDDFTRLTWVMLPLVLCRDGRGLDNPSWLRSKLYPLRSDVTLDMAQAALDWYANRGMIIRYTANGRNYFFVPTWHEYQTGTEKEAKSPYPAPPLDLLQTKSRLTLDKIETNENHNVYESVNESVKSLDDENTGEITPFRELSVAFVNYSKIPEFTGGPQKWSEGIRALVDLGATPDLVRQAIQLLQNKRYRIVGPGSIYNTVVNLIAQNGTETNLGGYTHA